MEDFTHIVLLLLVLPGIISHAYPHTLEELPSVAECRAFCESYKRTCQREPMECGGCMHSYIMRDGICYPADDDNNSNNQVEDAAIPLDDKDIDLMVARRTATNPETAFDQTDPNAVQSLALEAQGEGAIIPENAQIHRIVHDPSDNQQRKVHDVFKAAGATETAAKPITEDAAANMADVYFLAVIAGCSIAGLIGLVVAGVCWYRLQKNVKAASESEYPTYGVTGPEKVSSPGDRKLAQSAQMYHYQHQKQQMIAMEKANGDMTKDGSDADSEEENEEGDYTVYECPGLAPTGEMEVKNPLFSEETPVTPSEPNIPK